MDEKKNTDAVEDFKVGPQGKDQDSLISNRSKENEEGLKKKIELDESIKGEETKDDEDEDEDLDDEIDSPILTTVG